MAKTKIEWCDYTVNPVKGLCPVGCSYCYARAMYKRFGWDSSIRYMGRLNFVNELLRIPRDERRRVFVGSTIELFGPWVDQAWLTEIIDACSKFECHTFLFLTKKPENLIKWSPFPDNCWVGATATDHKSTEIALHHLFLVEAPVKFISLEPLLGRLDIWRGTDFLGVGLPCEWNQIDWLIIGQCTPVCKATMPKVEWIREIVDAADKAGVPVFLKDNLKVLLPEAHPFYTFPWESDPEAGASVLRQEFPR